MKHFIRYTSCIFIALVCHSIRAQSPVNDNCETAMEIRIPDAGFGFDTISSLKVNVQKATRQQGEHCAEELEENGNCVKTVWYKFYLATTRNVAIRLAQQDSAIPQIFSGFNLYKINNCSYTLSDFAKQLTPLSKFGISGNACLEQGWYMIQVGCKQKAKGEIWVDLEVSMSPAEKYDHINGYYDFNAQFNGYSYKRFDVQCASVDKAEAAQLKDSAYSKSIWMSCQVQTNSEQSSLVIYTDAKYRIFVDNLHPDSIFSTKPFLNIQNGSAIISELCPGYNTTRRYYIQVVVSNGTTRVDMSFQSANFNRDPWNTTNTNEIIDLPANTVKNNLVHTYNCESKLASHPCKNAVPSFYIKEHDDRYVPNKKVTDTFRYAGYTILNIKEDGLLRIRNYSNAARLITIYEGDITQSCQLTPVADSLLLGDYWYATHCLKQGTYTLVIASISMGTSSQLHLETINRIPDPRYTVPSTPEKLPDYKPSERKTINSDITSFRPQDTSITISNMTFRGAFIFREIYISESGELEIGLENNLNEIGYLMIFSGQISKGTVAAIPTIDYSRWYYRSTSEMSQFNGGHQLCFNIAKGYYTLIAWNGYRPQYDNILPCMVTRNQLYVKPIDICPSYTNTEPELAFKLNYGKNIFDSVPRNFSYNHQYALVSCNFCSSRSRVIPAVSCKFKTYLTPKSTYHYYTFYIDENATAFINTSAYELYEGDVLKDPDVIKDTSNIIDPCDNGRLICNLRGKKTYTLVLFNQYNGIGYSINFAKIRRSDNDFADHAYDMGHISSDTAASPLFPITCHTNGFKSDPAPNLAVKGTVEGIPFPDTLNYKRKDTRMRNLWFTFTSSGNSDIIIHPKYYPGYYSSYPPLYVLKYKGTYHQNFNDVLADGLDSTMASLEPVLYGQNGNIITFTNTGCQDNRYFVIAYGNFENYSDYTNNLVLDYGLEVISTSNNHPPEGDQCHTAISGKYTRPGKYTVTADNACHTYGNSIFEENPDPKLKSTWFRIEVDSLEKFDLQVRNLKGTGLLRYNVYGGTCKAMTRIARQGDRYAYFTLTCMGKGIYFIQAICDMSVGEQLAFEVQVTDASKSPCKPYDFKYPIAQFDYRGGCHTNDSIIFRNLSTKGEDMEYTWYLNGKTFSTELNPLLFRTDKDMLPLDTFKLIILNTAENIRDTFSLAYKKDTTIYEFRIDAPPFFKCRDTLRLKIKTNYTGRLNYMWYDSRKTLLSTYPQLTQNYIMETNIRVYGESDNCHFTDSLPVRILKTLNKYRDSFVCGWNPYIIRNTGQNYSISLYWMENGNYQSENIMPGDAYTIPKSGTYYIYYIEENCIYFDTMTLTIETGLRLLTVTDNIYSCNTAMRTLAYTKDTLLNYKWNTGDTTPAIVVDKSGTYRLTGKFSRCRSLSYTINLIMEKLSVHQMRDTILCKYDRLSFVNPYGPNFRILYREPNQDTLKITGPVKRVLRLQRSECHVEDSAMTDIFPFEGRSIDSFYCDPKTKFSMFLDGGNAKDYNWYHQNARTRQLQIFNYGNYPVARIDTYGCKDTLNYNVITNCEFTVFVPNAFSPNNDLTNELFGPAISGRYSGYKMDIFNNWGELVFHGENGQFWDGRYKEHFNAGVYGFVITVYDEDHKPFLFKGTVTLLY